MQRQEKTCVRVVSKRKGMFQKTGNEVVVDVDRTNKVLGNPFILKNRYDDTERKDVIQKYRELIESDMAIYGPKFDAILRLTNIVISGNNLVLRCWCKELSREVPCHGDIIKEKIEEILNILESNDV